MKRLLRWIGVGVASLAVLATIGYAVAYVFSERALKHETGRISSVGMALLTRGWRPDQNVSKLRHIQIQLLDTRQREG